VLTLWVGLLACGWLLRADAPTRARLLETVVAQSLRLADEEDPLRRADVCNDVAELLARAVRQASERGDTAEAVRLGRYLHKLMDRGVARNIARTDPDELDEPRYEEWVEVGRRAEQIGLTLENELAQAARPPAPPLRHVLDESRKDWERWWHELKGKKGKDKKGKDRKGKDKKGKGKDWEKDWQKELEKEFKGKDKKGKDKKGKGKKGDDPFDAFGMLGEPGPWREKSAPPAAGAARSSGLPPRTWPVARARPERWAARPLRRAGEVGTL
jgi:hypothetical protein